jgi:predicted ester cyclase
VSITLCLQCVPFSLTIYTINDMVAEEDKVAFRFTWTATNQSDAMDGALKGKQFKIIEDYFCRLDKGKIVEFRNLLDRLSWFEQAGITPPIGEGNK